MNKETTENLKTNQYHCIEASAQSQSLKISFNFSVLSSSLRPTQSFILLYYVQFESLLLLVKTLRLTFVPVNALQLRTFPFVKLNTSPEKFLFEVSSVFNSGEKASKGLHHILCILSQNTQKHGLLPTVKCNQAEKLDQECQ